MILYLRDWILVRIICIIQNQFLILFHMLDYKNPLTLIRHFHIQYNSIIFALTQIYPTNFIITYFETKLTKVLHVF